MIILPQYFIPIYLDKDKTLNQFLLKVSNMDNNLINGQEEQCLAYEQDNYDCIRI